MMFHTGWREPSPSADAATAKLVLDATDGSEIPRFVVSGPGDPQETSMERAATAGAERSRISSSGSGQFSVGGWEALQREIARLNPSHLVVVDLRKESHGFLNREAVSWYATQNWGCAGLSQAEALDLERIRLKLVSQTPSIFVGTKKSVVGQTREGVEYMVESVLTERELVERSGVEYVRIPVNDHCRPDDAAVTELVQLFSRVPEHAHLHFHCRGGKGRTATALALLDIYLHAGSQPLAEILTRQSVSTAYTLANVTGEMEPYKKVLRQDRLQMLIELHTMMCA